MSTSANSYTQVDVKFLNETVDFRYVRYIFVVTQLRVLDGLESCILRVENIMCYNQTRRHYLGINYYLRSLSFPFCRFYCSSISEVGIYTRGVQHYPHSCKSHTLLP